MELLLQYILLFINHDNFVVILSVDLAMVDNDKDWKYSFGLSELHFVTNYKENWRKYFIH